MPSTNKTSARRRTSDPSTILDRWLPYALEIRAKACSCSGCRRARARRFRCRVCGYRGEPVVHPCDCFTRRGTEDLGQLSEWLRKREQRGDEDGAQQLRAQIANLLTEGRCPCGDGNQCGHGAIECPVCVGGIDDWTHDEDRLHPWKIIRALRRELARRQP